MNPQMVSLPCPIVQLFRSGFAESLGKLGLRAACLLSARRIRKFYNTKGAVSGIGAPSANALLHILATKPILRGTALGRAALEIRPTTLHLQVLPHNPHHLVVAAMVLRHLCFSFTFTRTSDRALNLPCGEDTEWSIEHARFSD